jgi:hypothetical protein
MWNFIKEYFDNRKHEKIKNENVLTEEQSKILQDQADGGY